MGSEQQDVVDKESGNMAAFQRNPLLADLQVIKTVSYKNNVVTKLVKQLSTGQERLLKIVNQGDEDCGPKLI